MRKTHRSSKGPKLFIIKDSKGRFKDIQTYERAHKADMKRRKRASQPDPDRG